MMVVTVAGKLTRNSVLLAHAISKRLVLLGILLLQLEMVTAMMIPTPLTVTMMVGTAVGTLTQITVLSVLAIFLSHVVLDFLLPLLEMVSAMMKPTYTAVFLMALTAVDMVKNCPAKNVCSLNKIKFWHPVTF